MLQHGNMYNATYVRIHPTLEQNWGYFINSVVFLYFLNPFPIFDHFTMNIIFDNYLSNYVKIAIYWNFSPLFVLTSFMNASLFILLGDKHRQQGRTDLLLASCRKQVCFPFGRLQLCASLCTHGFKSELIENANPTPRGFAFQSCSHQPRQH